MPVIVTVHGISTKGEWQERIGGLLGSHFRYCAIQYSQYRRLGALKLVVDPWVLAAAVVTVATAAALGHPADSPHVALIVAITLIAAHVGARLRREDALHEFKFKFDEAVKGGLRPHVIAHSFGTYLTATALRRFPDLRLQKVIFAGSVLSTKYDWEHLIFSKQTHQIRNEIARHDNVSRFAYFLHGIVPGMGHSGFSGFCGAHELANPTCSCSQCQSEPSFIHNVKNSELGHSDHIFSIGYAEKFWLPFLWDIDAEAYSSFLLGCEHLLELQERGARHELRKALLAFRSSPWIKDGCTVGEYVSRELDERLRDCPWVHIRTEDVIVHAIHNICRIISDAQRELQKGKEGDPKLVRALHPETAVCKALNIAVEDLKCLKSEAARSLD